MCGDRAAFAGPSAFGRFGRSAMRTFRGPREGKPRGGGPRILFSGIFDSFCGEACGMETVVGTISGIIFENDETGYRVLDVETEDGGYVTVTGTMPEVYAGEVITCTGEFSEHPDYGPQFKAVSLSLSLPVEKDGIRAFLASGIIPGVGPGTASRIVSKFGRDTLNIIQLFPERLSEVKGITPQKASTIAAAFEKHRESGDTLVFLAGFGVGTNVALNLYKAFGDETIGVIKDDPYFPVGNVRGYGFQSADKVAMALGFAADSPERVRAVVMRVLRAACQEGHVYLPLEDLIRITAGDTGAGEEVISDGIDELTIRRDVFKKELRLKTESGDPETVSCVWLRELYDAERLIEKKLSALADVFPDHNGRRIAKLVSLFDKENGISLDEYQKEAVVTAAENGVTVITGGPGTGKTTIIKGILRVLGDRGAKTALTAPTGRAAKRMSQACGEPAFTIHRLLEPDFRCAPDDGDMPLDDSRVTFRRNAANPLPADYIIVDEVSMVDTLLMAHLLEAVKDGARIVLVGDNDQLPSVGAGRVLRDVITSGKFRTIALKNIYRQDPDSLISYNAYLINNGMMPEMNKPEGDFFRMTVRNPYECVELVRSLAARRLPDRYGIDPFTSVQVITPNKKGQSGSESLNLALQEALNPKLSSRTAELRVGPETFFRCGDRVMQIRNNYQLAWDDYDDPAVSGEGVFNGEMGRIDAIDVPARRVYVLFDDNRYVCYEGQNVLELELCYAVTVHKSQGSEFDYCIIPISGASRSLMTRNLLYTAVTRAKKMAVILGTADEIKTMIDNNREVKRYTTLFKRIAESAAKGASESASKDPESRFSREDTPQNGSGEDLPQEEAFGSDAFETEDPGIC